MFILPIPWFAIFGRYFKDETLNRPWFKWPLYVFSLCTVVAWPILWAWAGVGCDYYNNHYTPGLFDPGYSWAGVGMALSNLFKPGSLPNLEVILGHIRWSHYPGTFFAIGLTSALIVLILDTATVISWTFRPSKKSP